MMERIDHFLPSLVLLGSITAALWIDQIVMRRRWKKKLDSIAWWKENHKKAFLRLSGPMYPLLILREELVFRAPLIIAFGSLSPRAWIAVLLAATVFAVIHYFGKKVNISEVLLAHEKGQIATGSIKEAVSQLEVAMKKEIRRRRLITPGFMLFLGILTGYCGIRYQSLLLVVGIRVVWNFIAPILFVVAMFIVEAGINLVVQLWERPSSKNSPE